MKNKIIILFIITIILYGQEVKTELWSSVLGTYITPEKRELLVGLRTGNNSFYYKILTGFYKHKTNLYREVHDINYFMIQSAIEFEMLKRKKFSNTFTFGISLNKLTNYSIKVTDTLGNTSTYNYIYYYKSNGYLLEEPSDKFVGTSIFIQNGINYYFTPNIMIFLDFVISLTLKDYNYIHRTNSRDFVYNLRKSYIGIRGGIAYKFLTL